MQDPYATNGILHLLCHAGDTEKHGFGVGRTLSPHHYGAVERRARPSVVRRRSVVSGRAAAYHAGP